MKFIFFRAIRILEVEVDAISAIEATFFTVVLFVSITKTIIKIIEATNTTVGK
jgi:hypothetical protein